MVSKIVACMTEAELDTIEIRLRKKIDELVLSGKVSSVKEIEDMIDRLDDIDVCRESYIIEDVDRSEVREPRREREEVGTMGYF